MTIQRSGLFLLTLIVLGFVSVPTANADPLEFSNLVAVQNGTSIGLFANFGITLLGPQLTFLVDVTGTLSPGQTDVLQITYNEVGSPSIVQSFQIPAFGVVPPPYSQLFTITSPGATFEGIMASLTVDILSSSPDFVIPSGPAAGQKVDSYTYQFKVAKPVPEPGTLLLFGGAIAAMAKSLNRRRRSLIE